jgi:hypothetical protein
VSGSGPGRQQAAAEGGGGTAPEPLRPAPAAWRRWCKPVWDCATVLQHQTGWEGAGASCYAAAIWCEAIPLGDTVAIPVSLAQTARAGGCPTPQRSAAFQSPHCVLSKSKPWA